MKKNGFTLAEVLITLTIVGVIAAITIPNLMRNWQEQALVSQLKSTYSILANAYQMAVRENGNVEEWDISNNEKFYKYLKPYLKISKECGETADCFANNYKALFNDNYTYQPRTYWSNTYGWKAILSNGSSMLIRSYSKCRGIAQYVGSANYYKCGEIYVDVNGYKGPNRAGVDYFNFTLFPEKLAPSDIRYTKGWQDSGQQTCKYNDKGAYNGSHCTGYVLRHGNMDYLRRDVSRD